MDREQLFKNLNELEKQLRGIKSATDQVNSVIESDRVLVESVKGFTAEAHKLLSGIKSAYDGEVAAVRESAMEVLRTATTQFEQKVDKISSKITRSTKELNTIVDEKLSPLVKDDLTGVIEGKLKPFVEKDLPKVDDISMQMSSLKQEIASMKKTCNIAFVSLGILIAAIALYFFIQ